MMLDCSWTYRTSGAEVPVSPSLQRACCRVLTGASLLAVGIVIFLRLGLVCSPLKPLLLESSDL